MNNIIKNNKYRPYLAALCAIGWSLAYPLIKSGYQVFNIGSDLGSKILFGGIRFAFAGLFVLLFGAAAKKDLKIKNPKKLGWILLFGLVNTCLHYTFAYIGLSNLPSSRSTILDSMGGFFLIILSGIIYKEDKISPKKLLGCLFGFFGIVLINIAPASELFAGISFKGDGFILINACFAALGGILTRVVSEKTNMTAATGFGMFFGGLIMVACAFAFGIKTKWSITAKGICILIILILISAVCFEIYNLLIANHPISKVAIFNALIPILGVMFSSVLLGEPFKWQYLAAGLSVALGIAIINRAK